MIRFPFELDMFRQTPAGVVHVARFALAEPGAYALGKADTNQIRLDSRFVSREHAWLVVERESLRVVDRGSTNHTYLGDLAVTDSAWDGRTPLRMGDLILYQAGVREVSTPKPVPKPAPGEAPTAIADAAVPRAAPPGANGAPDASQAAPQAVVAVNVAVDGATRVRLENEARREIAFPANVFTGPIVSTAAIRASGHLAGECEYLALGGGIGSFVWVDHLRVWGVPSEAIRVIGVDEVPYANYQRLCRNSQIPSHERLRSNSASAPDNLWGFPGYASREAWRELGRLNLGGLKPVFQVFGEPALAESYTPRIGHVFASMDREMRRIGWRDMLLQGRIVSLRRTDDGRYAVAYRASQGGSTRVTGAGAGFPGAARERIVIARVLHIATGYPATRITDDLQDFKRRHPDAANVVTAYEVHDALYEMLAQARRPVTVVVRGRGIVASRVLQKLDEIRARNPQIYVLHLMRTPVPPEAGQKWGQAKRPVINHVEIQPFNWPKAAWGGDLRREIERATPEERSRMFAALGGTTTAYRRDWVEIVERGQREGWLRIVFGNIAGLDHVTPDEPAVKLTVAPADRGPPYEVVADAVIDCTGLVGDVRNSPFLRDLLDTYGLAQNRVSGNGPEQRLTGITVTNDFEIAGLRNGTGRVYAAGTITQNGPYAAVDSFLGLQYAALRSVDHLSATGAPGVGRLGPVESAAQWLRWCAGAAP